MDIKFSIISQISDLITTNFLIHEDKWRAICYSVPDLNKIYDENSSLINGRDWERDYFSGIDNILKYAYDKGTDTFVKLMRIIIETKKFSDNMMKGDIFIFELYEYGDVRNLSENYFKLKRLLNILDLDIEVVENQDDKYNFKLQDFNINNTNGSISENNILDEFLHKNVQTSHNTYIQMIRNYADGNPEACVSMARATLEGFYHKYSGDIDNEKWFKGATKLLGDPLQINNPGDLKDDFNENQKYPRFRFVYIFFKLVSVLGSHSGKETSVSKNSKKATMDDALLIMQVTRDIIYHGIKSINNIN